MNNEQVESEFYLITIIAKLRLAEKIDDIFHEEGTSGATTFLATCFDEDDRQNILDMPGQRKEVLMKATHRDQLDTILNHIKDKQPQVEQGENFLFVTPLSGLAGLDGYGDVEENPSFKEGIKGKQAPYKLVTVVCNYGEGEDYIDATQRKDILQHLLIKGHGSAKLSDKYEGRSFQSEKDIVMQIVPSESELQLKEVSKAYEGIQFSEAGAIIFTRDIVYLHRF